MATTQGRPYTWVMFSTCAAGWQALLQRLQVLLVQVGLGHAAVVLQGPDGSHQHHRRRVEVGQAALDVQKLLRAQVSAEARLGDGVVPHLEGHPGGHDGVAAVGNVGEGPPWMKAGVPSRVWTRLGLMASFSRAAMAPSAFRSWAVMGLPARE